MSKNKNLLTDTLSNLRVLLNSLIISLINKIRTSDINIEKILRQKKMNRHNYQRIIRDVPVLHFYMMTAIFHIFSSSLSLSSFTPFYLIKNEDPCSFINENEYATDYEL